MDGDSNGSRVTILVCLVKKKEKKPTLNLDKPAASTTAWCRTGSTSCTLYSWSQHIHHGFQQQLSVHVVTKIQRKT